MTTQRGFLVRTGRTMGGHWIGPEPERQEEMAQLRASWGYPDESEDADEDLGDEDLIYDPDDDPIDDDLDLDPETAPQRRRERRRRREWDAVDAPGLEGDDVGALDDDDVGGLLDTYFDSRQGGEPAELRDNPSLRKQVREQAAKSVRRQKAMQDDAGVLRGDMSAAEADEVVKRCLKSGKSWEEEAAGLQDNPPRLGPAPKRVRYCRHPHTPQPAARGCSKAQADAAVKLALSQGISFEAALARVTR